MWNDTETPLAYLITFRCRGTWLHGDVRGSVDRFNNTYGTPYLPPDDELLRRSRLRLVEEPVTLDAERRACVEEAMRETCDFRGWTLYALNLRTNHVHAVTSIGEKRPTTALNALKSNATRKMRSSGCWSSEMSPWADKGSTKYLWNEGEVMRAVEYVLDGQGDDLPTFDRQAAHRQNRLR